jgi:WD40 repeat protein
MGSYDMKSTARCLAALADESRHSFLVSTANLRGPNEVRLLRYSEEDDDVRCAAIWHHNYEVSSLSSNATEPTLLATAYSTLDEKGARATVWRLTDLHEGGEGEDGEGGGGGGRFSEPLVKDLGVVAELPQATAADGGADPLFHVQWAPQVAGHDADELVTAHAGSARSWRLRADGSVAPAGVARFPHEANFVGAVAWDPHRPAEVAVAADAEVVFWDLRSGECARSVGGAVAVAGGVVRAVSFNPNKPFHVATAGDDFGVKIWDARRPSAPLKILEGHSHW